MLDKHKRCSLSLYSNTHYKGLHSSSWFIHHKQQRSHKNRLTCVEKDSYGYLNLHIPLDEKNESRKLDKCKRAHEAKIVEITCTNFNSWFFWSLFSQKEVIIPWKMGNVWKLRLSNTHIFIDLKYSKKFLMSNEK
jgi:hypothetical protein